MAKPLHDTPLLDKLESGPWPSFITGIKRLAQTNNMAVDLLGQLERSYTDKLGYWKGGTVGVRGYGGGIIPRFSELVDDDGKPLFPDAAEFHTLRIMPPAGMHYNTAILRSFCDLWEKWGSGLITLHGQSGDIQFQGCTTDNAQPFFDEINELGFDLGGAGPDVRTSMSCVGAARCEHSCFDEQRVHRMVVNAFLDDLHRPSLPYKFKFKFSGCANDCTNAVHRSDFAVLGTWRDAIRVDQDEVRKFVRRKGRDYVMDNVITRCPSRALHLEHDNSLTVDNHSCVHCMHCINVMTRALSPGKERGAAILMGGKRTLKRGDMFGVAVVPFIRLETDDDYERLLKLAKTVVEFFADNALEHERIGEMIDRIGLAEFLDGLGLDIDPNMVLHPRTSSYARMDQWDEEAAKWYRRHELTQAVEPQPAPVKVAVTQA